jgi:hypothetical protein
MLRLIELCVERTGCLACSFWGGAGGSSTWGAFGPSGPKGPRESSRDSSFVVWAATRLIGVRGPRPLVGDFRFDADETDSCAGADFGWDSMT